jgi:hypothetical protein
MTLNCYENLRHFLHISKLVLEPVPELVLEPVPEPAPELVPEPVPEPVLELTKENQLPLPTFEPCIEVPQPQEYLDDSSEGEELIEDGNV